MQYVLNADHSVEPMDDIVEWARRLEVDDRVVAQDRHGETLISTTFIGIAHGHDASGKPLLFETMVFKGPHDGRCWRYPTYGEAVAGHKRAVKEIAKTQGA